MHRLPLITLSLAAAAAAFICLGEPATLVLQYDRSAVMNGEPWRFVTCQWTHWSLDHAAWDVAVFIGLGALCETWDRRRFAAAVLLSAVGVPLVVHLFCPAFTSFRGLSGVDSALFGLATALYWRDAFHRHHRVGAMMAGLAFVLFFAKTIFEVVTGSTVFVDSKASGFVAVPEAHLAGFLIGATSAFLPLLKGATRRTGTSPVPSPRADAVRC